MKRKKPTGKIPPKTMLLIITLLLAAPFLLVYSFIQTFFAKTYWKVWIYNNWYKNRKRVFFIYPRNNYNIKHIESKILPRIKDTAVIIDWDDRGGWPKGERYTIPIRIFKAWGGDYPMALGFMKPYEVKMFNFRYDFYNAEYDLFEYLAGIK